MSKQYHQITCKEFYDWFCEMSDHDKNNFRAFFGVDVVTTMLMISKLDNGLYKEMLLFVLNVKTLVRL